MIQVTNQVADIINLIDTKAATTIYVPCSLNLVAPALIKHYYPLIEQHYIGTKPGGRKPSQYLQYDIRLSHFTTPDYRSLCINGIDILDITKLLGPRNDYTNQEQVVEAVQVLYKLFPYYGRVPSAAPSIIINRLSKLNPMMSNCTKELFDVSNAAFYPGALALLMPRYKVVPHEVHLDVHQAYSNIVRNYLFPPNDPAGLQWSNKLPNPAPRFYFIRLACLNGIHVKEGGFPLLSPKLIETTNAEFITLCSIDYQVWLDNYEQGGVEVMEVWYWNDSVGIRIPGAATLIDQLYTMRRQSTNPVLSKACKFISECIPGMLERRTIQDHATQYTCAADPFNVVASPVVKGSVSKLGRIRLNRSWGCYITAYLRLQLSNVLKHFKPHEVVGFDTDGVFLNGITETDIKERGIELGDDMGQFHIDADYIDCVHLAPKQYYGIDAATRAVVGKLCGVSNGNEVAAYLMNHPDTTTIEVSRKLWDEEAAEYIDTKVMMTLGKEVYTNEGELVDEYYMGRD